VVLKVLAQLPLGRGYRQVYEVDVTHVAGDVNNLCLAYHYYCKCKEARGGVVVKALRYKPIGRGFDSRCCHWNFSVT
jgi:hypothetical protein